MAAETKTPAKNSAQGNRNGGRSGEPRRDTPRSSGPSQPRPPRPVEPKPAEPKVIELPESISLRDLATKINVSPINVIRELMQNGVMATINQPLDFDTAAIVASAFGWEARPIPIVVESQPPAEVAVTPDGTPAPTGKIMTLRQRLLAKEQAENESALKPRPPIVTVMGHVDHGKTSLLDAIRKTDVASAEAGGITQHIGAYMVEHQGKKVTFIDTPGHEAFTAMRARGAQVTDIAVLVVAADDGVMPQTREAIAHARAAQVPIIVAINKIDKPNANPELVKKELSELGLVPDEWGGQTLFIPVSAKQRKGIEDLIEGILLVAESLDTIKANPNRRAVGTIIESHLSKSRGAMATVLVQNGTLNVGDAFVAGSVYGRVRAMFDFRGQSVKKAGPSVPVSITGMSEVPIAGDIFEVVEDERAARALAAQNQAKRAREGNIQRVTSLEQYFAMAKASKAKKMFFIVKADSQGSLQPIVEQLHKLNSTLGGEPGEEIRLEVIHQGTGDVTESDVNLAIASGAVILGYEVQVDTAARRKAESNHVDIRLYNVIYNLLEDVELALKGMLAPKIVEKVVGVAEVKQTFKIPKVGIIAGVRVTNGVAMRNAKVRILRGEQVLHTGAVASLKRLTEDVKEVRQGFECGIGIEGFEGFKPGDVIEFIVQEAQS
ncbi:MAG: translation initiation factor IF-2 [Chloroflexi bacterium]|uniref:Translation initiation factor IF-2 n=1 Tax=Candidatus Thermofonsia Clade 3 bacterium TaxID=2364212 RepID=A0A2M8QBW9_9CHLR|nr:translation initiation factor IF-2 [Candidatus Roseilinea sp. NK_OTU-006]PJF47303.1 MAG: translation initiation factor IF-2 [Candidatus Thermofonsia Clade 3 bacterium]RMG63038.1 MAG: translation initiation factor IF-2 [Chloroflexota bacterium]